MTFSGLKGWLLKALHVWSPCTSNICIFIYFTYPTFLGGQWSGLLVLFYFLVHSFCHLIYLVTGFSNL